MGGSLVAAADGAPGTRSGGSVPAGAGGRVISADSEKPKALPPGLTREERPKGALSYDVRQGLGMPRSTGSGSSPSYGTPSSGSALILVMSSATGWPSGSVPAASVPPETVSLRCGHTMR